MNTYKLEPDKLFTIRVKYPDRIPVYITTPEDSRELKITPKFHKFLIPSNYTFYSLHHIIRRWFKIDPQKSIFLFIDSHIPMSTATLGELYEKYKTPDGLLRIVYVYENAFG